MENVKVTVTVELGDDRKEFTASSDVAGDGVNVAEGLVTGLKQDATAWLWSLRRQRREAAAPVDVVYDLIADGVTSPGELEARSGYSETRVRNALKQLADEGKVYRVRLGVWEPARAADRTVVVTGG